MLNCVDLVCGHAITSKYRFTLFLSLKIITFVQAGCSLMDFQQPMHTFCPNGTPAALQEVTRNTNQSCVFYFQLCTC